MRRSSYSTGFKDLDTYLGGLGQGDTILVIHPGGRQVQFLLKGFTGKLRSGDEALRYISLSGSRNFLLAGMRTETLSQDPGGRNRSGQQLGVWLRRQAGTLRPGESLLTDDLAEWRRSLGRGSLLVEIVSHFSRMIVRKKGLGFFTARRADFTTEELGRLKDAVSVCIELSVLGGDLFILPLHLRGRYPVSTGNPFGFAARGLKRKGPASYTAITDFTTGTGGEIQAGFLEKRAVSDLLLDGPLRESKFGVLVADLSGEFRASNGHLGKIVGLQESERESRHPLSVVVGSDRRRVLRLVSLARNGKSVDSDVTLIGRGGAPVPVRIHAGPAGAGLTVFFVLDNRAGRDARNRLESIRQENRALFSDASYPICFADSRKIIRANATFSLMRNASEGSPVSGMNLRECFSPGTLQHLRKAVKEAGEEAEARRVAGEFIRADGKRVPVRIHVSAARHETKECCTLLLEDVSDYHAAIGTLEENERRYRSVAEQVSRPVALIRDTVILYANPDLLALMAVSDPGQLEGNSIADFIIDAPGREFLQAFASFLSSKQRSLTLETGVSKAGGEPFTAALTFRKGEAPARGDVILTVEDITARVEREARVMGVRAGTEQISTILETATTTIEPEKIVQAALVKSLDVLGWTGGLVYLLKPETRTFVAGYNRHFPKKLLEKISEIPADEGLGGYISKTLDSHIYTLGKYPTYLPYRTLFAAQKISSVCLIPLVHADASIGFILGVSTGKMSVGSHAAETLSTLGRQLGNALFNARKLAAMRESENKMHRVVESLSGVVYTAGPDGLIRTIDRGISQILGYAPRDFSRNRSLFLSLIHEEDKKIFLARVTGSEKLEPTFTAEYRMRPRAKASYRWIRDAVSVERDQGGHVTGFAGLLADVTEEHEKYETVRTEQTMLRSVQDALPDGIALFDAEGKCLEWNMVMEKITGVARMVALGREMSAVAVLPQEGTGVPLPEARKTAGLTRLGMVEGKHLPGTTFDVIFVPVPAREEEAGGFLLRYIDMTRPQAELRRLIESEQVLRNVIDAMDDVMVITDLSGRVAEVNSAFVRLTGFGRHEVIGQEFPYGWLVERDMGRFLLWISGIREQHKLRDFDITWRTKENAEVQMSLTTTLVRNSVGEPVAMLNIARDISERVKLSRELELRNNQIEMINRVISAANATNDFSLIFGTAVDEIIRLVPSHAVMIISAEDEPVPFSEMVVLGPGRLELSEVKPLMHAVAGVPGWVDSGAVLGDIMHDPALSSLRHLGDRVRSALVVPVETSHGPVGALLLIHRDPHAYSDDQITLCRPLARQLGGILERTRLFQRAISDSQSLKASEAELRERAAQLITLHEISTLLSNSFDMREILTSALPLLKSALGAAAVLVYLIEQDDGDLHLGDQVGLTLDDSSSLHRLRQDTSATGDVVRRKQPLYIGKAAYDDTRILQVNRKFLKDSSVEAMAIIPILSKDRVMGALNIFYSHTHEFLEQERRVLSLVGNQIGTMLLNVELYGELREQIGRLTVLFELSRDLTSVLDTEEICLVVTRQIGRLVECDRCVVSVLGEDSGELSTRVRLSRRDGEYIRDSFNDEDKPALSPDAQSAIGAGRTYQPSGGNTLVVPMISGRTAIGIIELTTGSSLALDEVQVRLLESIGSLTAIALKKGNLYEETVRKSREIERRNRELDDFTYVVSHDLKEPLISIEGFSRILQMDYGDTIQGEGSEYLDSLVGATTRMKGLIDDLLMLSRVSSPAESQAEVALSDLVSDILADMEFVIRKKNVELQVQENLPTITGNALQLKILLRNLIGNAIKFNDKDHPSVEIGFQYPKNNSYLFWVKDNGIGIDSDFFEKIFIVFQRLHRREEFEGSGAGLAIVKKIIEIHHGKIWVESEKGRGSTFYFTLPSSTP